MQKNYNGGGSEKPKDDNPVIKPNESHGGGVG